MAKLFKSISLEERWKNSPHSQGPTTPKSVEQGRIDLKAEKPLKDLPTAQLKQMPNAVEKNSILLKAMIKSRPESLPIPRPLETKSLTRFALPFVNTKFRSAISLADRLGQPKLGSTTHLAQFFLSDSYTDYIKITPFGIFNHTSNITLLPFNFVPQQGGNNPIIPIGQVNQGGLNPTAITFESLLHQGVFLSNGVYASVINPTMSVLADALIVDPLINTPSTPGPDANITNPGITPTTVPSILAVEFMQGVIYDPYYNLISGIQPPTPPTILPQVPASIVITNSIITPNQGGLVTTNLMETPVQGGKDAIPFNFDPNSKGQSPVLDVLKYEAQRALANFAPRVVHGSANLTNPRYGQTFILGSTSIDIDRVMEHNMRIDPNLISYINDLKIDSGKTRSWKYDVVGVKVELNGNSTYPNIETIDGVQNPSSQIAKLLGDTRNTDEPLTNLSTFVETKAFDKTKIQPVKTGINAYATLAYDQIKSREKDRADGKILKDFRADLPGLKGGNGKAVVITDSTGKTVNERGMIPGEKGRTYDNDFVNVQIHSQRDGVTTYFRAFLTSFSDSINASWNDINYVGRQDTLKAFKGSTRGGSLGFKVAALREEDLAFNYFKLNELIKSAGVGNTTPASPNEYYVRGPLCSLTVGRWFKDTPVIFNSIKYDIQVAEYSWDIDQQMPHIVDVSLDFVVLGDTNGDPLNAGTNRYFNYTGK